MTDEDGDVLASYGYDNNGNETTRGSDTFIFDHENWLTQSVIGGATSSSIYNGDGVRMSHTASGNTTNYTWDIGARLPVVLQDSINTYVYGLDLISATDQFGTQTYLHYDSLGSSVNLTDGAGTVIFSYWYDAFGGIRHQSGAGPANYWQFTGEQRDSDSSLYFLRARFYDPTTGRFIGRDPAGAGHPYAYVENNPIKYVDPYGLDVCSTVGGLLGKKKSCKETAEGAAGVAVDTVEKVAEPVVATVAQIAESACNPYVAAIGCVAPNLLEAIPLDDLGYIDVNGQFCYGICVTVGVQASFGEGIHPYAGGGVGAGWGISANYGPGQHISTGWSCGVAGSVGFANGQFGQSGFKNLFDSKEGTWFGEFGVSIGTPASIAVTCVYVL